MDFSLETSTVDTKAVVNLFHRISLQQQKSKTNSICDTTSTFYHPLRAWLWWFNKLICYPKLWFPFLLNILWIILWRLVWNPTHTKCPTKCTPLTKDNLIKQKFLQPHPNHLLWAECNIYIISFSIYSTHLS